MKEIKKYLESRHGEYSFFFEDLDCGYVYGFNENNFMPSAGCIKLPIAMALLKECEGCKLDLTDKVKITHEDKINGNGILHEFSDREYTIKELLIAMIIQSDNTATNKLINILSIDNINKIIKDMGLKNTKLNVVTMEEKLHDGVNENITTALDLNNCWKHLYKKSFLNEENSEFLLDILKKQQLKNKLSYYFYSKTKETVASKSGDLKNIENDSILFEMPKGNFTFTVLSNALPSNVYGTVSLSKAGKMMFDIVSNDWSK